jgi:hypothetical protein
VPGCSFFFHGLDVGIDPHALTELGDHLCLDPIGQLVRLDE